MLGERDAVNTLMYGTGDIPQDEMTLQQIVAYLVDKYPELCKLKKTNKKKSDKKTGKPWTEITMRDTRGKKDTGPKVFGVEVLREYTESTPKDYEDYVNKI